MSHIPGKIYAIIVAVISSLNVWFSFFFFFTLTSPFFLVFSLCYPQIQIHILNVLTDISIFTSVSFNKVSLCPSLITCIFRSGYSFRNVVVHLSSITSNGDISVIIMIRLRAGDFPATLLHRVLLKASGLTSHVHKSRTQGRRGD